MCVFLLTTDNRQGDSEEITNGASPSKASSRHSPHTLSDIFEKSEPFTSPSKSYQTKASPSKYPESSTEYESTDFHDSPTRDASPQTGCGMDLHHGHKPLSKQQTRSSRAAFSMRTREGTDCTTLVDTAHGAEAGSDLDGRASQASTVFTFSNVVVCMCSACLYDVYECVCVFVCLYECV